MMRYEHPLIIYELDGVLADCSVREAAAEAAKLLGVGKLTAQKWTREGRLAGACVSGPNVDARHGYLLNKEKLMQWRKERLTFGEAVQLLGVSKATLHRWVVENKIKPLDDREGKQRWFLKQDILELHVDITQPKLSALAYRS